MPIEQTNRPWVKRCPICGNTPSLDTHSLDRGNGHGYPACFIYSLKCDLCGLVKAQSDSVGRSNDEAKLQVVENWNEEVDKVEQFLANKNK